MAASAAARPGRMITFEGIDGAGKSSQLLRAIEFLRGRGIDPVITREPGGTPLGEALRTLLLGEAMTPLAELLLMFAARAQNLAATVRPALAAGRVVLCDRFSDASFAYQSGGRGLPPDWVTTLEHWTHPHFQPDGTLLFDLAPEQAARRLHASDRGDADRFEREQADFFARVRAAYLERVHRAPERFVVIDAGQDPAAVAGQVQAALQRWIA